MTVRVVWSPSALREIAQVMAYLRAFNPAAATKVATALIAAGDGLVSFPRRGRLVPGTDKRELVAAFPYVLRYRVAGDEVRILRVRHAARRPTRP